MFLFEFFLSLSLSSFFKFPLFIRFKAQRLTDCNTSSSTNGTVTAADYSHHVSLVAYQLRRTGRNLDISACLDPVQVTGDPAKPAGYSKSQAAAAANETTPICV
jgi:hypothetical protein